MIESASGVTVSMVFLTLDAGPQDNGLSARFVTLCYFIKKIKEKQ